MVAALLGGAALGGLAGYLGGGDKSQTYTKQMAPESALESRVTGDMGTDLDALRRMIGMGPGDADITAGMDSQRGLAAMLSQFSQGGFMPNQGQIDQSNQFAQQMFAPQYESMRQGFQEQEIGANRQAALMGRAGNDPVLRAKLAQSQMQQQGMLDSQRGAFAAQFAQQMPMQQLGFAQQLSQVQGGLATQALANRQALLSAGQSIKQQEQNFRLGGASTTVSQSGNPWASALMGALGGAGSGLNFASAFAKPNTTPGGQPVSTAGGSYTNFAQFA